MKSFCGVIRNFDEENRLFDLEYKGRIYYFHLTRSQLKKFSVYLQTGLYVFFKTFDEPKRVNKVMAFEIINFIKLVRHKTHRTVTYYDIQTIKDGVKKLLKKDNYRMFIDLEFTMPPFGYSHQNWMNKGKFYSEIIQYGIYLEDSSGNAIDSAKGFIRPKCELGINERTCEFVHLSKNELRHAPYYSKFYNILKNYMMMYQPVIYIWGKNDYLMIERSYKIQGAKPITERKNFINLMQIMKNYYNVKDDIGLYNAFDLLGASRPMEVQDHDAFHDTLATVEVFHHFLNEIGENE